MRKATYRNGIEVLPGDRVLIEHGRTEGIVEELILAADDIALWGVGEPGAMLLAKPFGRVFWPLDDHDDPMLFAARGEVPGTAPSP